jgi:hypothetical protein
MSLLFAQLLAAARRDVKDVTLCVNPAWTWSTRSSLPAPRSHCHFDLRANQLRCLFCRQLV